MTEQDTIRITFNHSSCMWHAYERLEISKESDSLKIISWYLNLTDDINNTNWEKIYEKKILQNDTSWKFSEFLKRNNNRRFQEEKRHVHLFMTDQKDTVRYFTKGLSEINHFSSDYYETMRKIYFDNETGYYGYVVD